MQLLVLIVSALVIPLATQAQLSITIESLANLPNNTDYKFSMIELGRDGYMYYNAGNRVSRIMNPNEINPSNLIMQNDPFGLIGATTQMAQTPCYQTSANNRFNIYNLPDQIDGDNYSSIWTSGNFVTIQNNSIPNCTNTSNPATLTASGSGLAGFIWSTGQSTAAITSTVAGTYTVTATDYCGNTCSTNYNLISCCAGIPSYEINGDIKVSDMINNPGPYANFFFFQTGTGRWTLQTDFNCSLGNNSLKVILNGRLTIDVNTDFTSLELICGPDAEIVVTPTAQLRLYETCNYLHGCGASMWKGITLQGNNYALEIGADTWIEDAKQAVTATNNSKFWINNTIFNKNYAAVVVTNTNGLANTSNIVNSKFQCNNLQTGLPAKCLSPYQNQRSTYGVWLTRVDGITIGETSLAYPATNTFQNLDYGVYCDKSDALIRNNVFTNMPLNDPLDLGLENGYGIYATGSGTNPLLTSSITVGEATPASQNIFNYCYTGVFFKSYTEARIQNNSFTSNQYGVFINSLKDKSVDIFNNSFETNYSAVFGSDIKNSTAPIAVYNNQINKVKGNGFNGIMLGSNNGLNFNCSIYNNIIKSCRNSISVISANEANVSNNTISITLPVGTLMPNHVGIMGRGCNQFDCYSNAVNWVNHPSLNVAYQKKAKAFSINGCNKGFVELNHNYNCGIGFETIGSCPNLLYTCNDNHGCYTAFYMTGSTLPKQYKDFTGNPKANGNTYFGNVGTFKIDGMSALSGNQANWYFDINDPNATLTTTTANPTAVTIQGINSSSICSNPIAPPDDEMINRFINDSITYNIYPDENNYLGDEYAYAALKNSSNGLTNLDSMLRAQFVDSLDNHTIGQFYEVERLLNDENFAAAAALNSSINDNRIIAVNKKTVNEIYLHSLAAGLPLDSTDKAALYAIAIQNSMAGGNGVFWARSLLGLEFEDELNDIFRTAQTTLPADKLNTRVTVVPNPTNGKVVVSANETIENVMSYDGMLAPIPSQTLLMDSQTMQLDLSNEKSGCFILKVIFKTHTEYYKVVLVK